MSNERLAERIANVKAALRGAVANDEIDNITLLEFHRRQLQILEREYDRRVKNTKDPKGGDPWNSTATPNNNPLI